MRFVMGIWRHAPTPLKTRNFFELAQFGAFWCISGSASFVLNSILNDHFALNNMIYVARQFTMSKHKI